MIYALLVLVLVLGGLAGWWAKGRRVLPPPAITPVQALPRLSVVQAERLKMSDAPFCVVTKDGKVHYEGASGGDARRCIEGLRESGATWGASRNGQPWDWGPR